MATLRICSIPDCGKKLYYKGYCQSHLKRFLRHGDPLAGNIAWGEAIRYVKEVAAKYDGEDCLIWPYARITSGYGTVYWGGTNKRAPRIVCELAHGAPPSTRHQAAHSCGNGHLGCVSPKHLSWKTHKENMADKEGHGTLTRGEAISKAKLTEAAVREMKANGFSNPALLAKRYGVSTGAISAVKCGKSWAWVTI